MKNVIKLITCICWFSDVYLFFEIDISKLSLLKTINNKETYFIKSTEIFKNKHKIKYKSIVISPC
jgi:hypothetical protein